MITFLNILISSSIIPKSDLVLSHNSSCDDLISTSPVPKSHIVMSHNSSCYDPNINLSCPKKHMVMSHNSSQIDSKLTYPVPKITSFSPKICLVMTISQLLLSQKVTSFCPIFHLVVTCNIDFSCPKSHLVLSHNSSCYDFISYSPVPKSHPVCLIICHVMTQYQLLLSQKVTFLCSIIHLVMT
jgi:hypothetical protein